MDFNKSLLHCWFPFPPVNHNDCNGDSFIYELPPNGPIEMICFAIFYILFNQNRSNILFASMLLTSEFSPPNMYFIISFFFSES